MSGGPTRASGPHPGVRSLSVVVPAFNEEARIGPALDELLAYLVSAPAGDLPAEVEVVVVDDGSTDGTRELVRARSGPATGGTRWVAVRLLEQPHRGKGAAVRAGMLAAEGDVAVFTDADMATPPSQLPRLVRALERVDVALGSRIQSDGRDLRTTQPPVRRLLGRSYRVIAGLWVSGPVRDTQCGFKGFRHECARDLFLRQRVTSIVFDVELIHLALVRGWTLTEVAIEWSDRRGSRMRPSLGLGLRVAVDLLRIPFLHRADRVVR